MTRMSLIYGCLAGGSMFVILIGELLLFGETHSYQEFGSYLLLLVPLLLVAWGIKSLRDNKPDGRLIISEGLFGGFVMSGIAAVLYALSWELYLFLTDYAQIPQYVLLEGNNDPVVDTELSQIRDLREGSRWTFHNPLVRFIVAILERFPLLFVISIVCTLLLREPNRFRKAANKA